MCENGWRTVEKKNIKGNKSYKKRAHKRERNERKKLNFHITVQREHTRRSRTSLF